MSQSSNSNNLQQEMLQDAIANIEAVEKELDEQFQFLGEEVDEGFAQLGSLCRQGMQIAKSVGKVFDSKKVAEGLGALAYVGGAVFGAMQQINVAVAHNEALDKLLKQKKKIATEKLAMIEVLVKKTERNLSSMRRLVDSEAGKEFDFSVLSKSEFALQLGNMIRNMALFRQSYYHKILTEFLCSEYKAWKRGEHYGSKTRPSYYDVNCCIVADFYKGQRVSAIIPHVFQKDVLSGTDVYVLTDASLLGPTLYNYGLLKKDKHGHIQMLPLPKSISPSAKLMLSNNIAYKSYKNQQFWFEHKENLVFLSIALIVMLFVVGLFSWLDWNSWIEWILGVILFGLGLWGAGSISFETGIQQDIYDKIRKKLMQLGGYVKIYRPDFDKKSVFWAGLRGAVKGLASSI